MAASARARAPAERHVGVVRAVHQQERPALEQRGVLGRVEDRELLGPGLDRGGETGRVDHAGAPAAGQEAPRAGRPAGPTSAGVPRQATPATRSSPAARCSASTPPKPNPTARRGAPSGISDSARKVRSSSQPSAEKSPADSPAPRRAAVTTCQPDSRASRSASGRIGQRDVGRRPLGRGRSWQSRTWPRTGAPGSSRWRRSTGRPPARAGA